MALAVGACEEGKPASADKKSTLSAAEPTATTPAPSQTADDSSRPTRKQKTRSRERSGRTASNGSREGARRGQTSSGTTAAERKASAEAQRNARSGAVAPDAPSTDPSQARDGEARDDWALYQHRKSKNRAK